MHEVASGGLSSFPEMTLFKKQNRITVVNHAVRDIVVSD